MRRILILSFIIIFALTFNLQAYAAGTFPKTGSPSVILIDSKTGQILYEKNSHEKHYPASITKVMTALLTLENCKLDDKTTASQRAVFDIEYGSNNAGFQPGEEFTIEELLYALLLNSANEAANILAEHVGGSIEGFADRMNVRAKELGALDTHFVTPNGLHKDDHYTTAYDMAMIARQAMTIPEFRKIVSTVLYKMPDTNKYTKGDKYFLNGNKLIRETHEAGSKGYYYPYAIGIKTGYTTKANHTFIGGAAKDGMELISVIMNSNIADGDSLMYSDSIELFDYVFENYNLQEPVKAGALIKQVSLPNSKDNMPLQITADKDISFICPKNPQSYTTNEYINPGLKAPIAKGIVVGHIDYLINGKVVGTANLVSSNDAAASIINKAGAKKFLLGALIALRNAGIILVVLLLGLLALVKTIRRKAKRNCKKNHSMKLQEILEDE